MSPPILLTAAHGTRDPRGTATVRDLLDAVRRARPQLDVRESYVDVVPPDVAEVAAQLTGPAVLVPLLLSTGYHVGVDLPKAAAGAPVPVTVAPPLGPDPALADLVARRVRAAAEAADAVVLAAAGSSDPAASRAVEAVAGAVSALLGVPVRPAYASAAAPTVDAAVRDLRSAGAARVVVARYLLAPGFFADRVAEAGSAAGATAVTDCLGADDALVRLVLRRYDDALAGSR